MLRENNYINIFKKTAILLAVFVVFLFAKEALAQQPDLGIESLAEGGLELGRTDIRIIVARIIQVFLGLLGMISVVLIIYGGFTIMTSAGDAQKVAKGKKILINAVIGLLIILSSVAIAQFVIGVLTGRTGGPGAGVAGPGAYSQPLSGSLGAGIISFHIPERGALAPRNTRIAITFKEAINATSLVEDTNGDNTLGSSGDQANYDVFKMTQTVIYKENNSSFKNISDKDLVKVEAVFTPDGKNFVFKPVELLGNPTEKISYTIFLSPKLKKADGANAFSGIFRDGYMWEFQVEPLIDTTAPKVISIIPKSGLNPRNTLVQINFSEAIDPTSASGDYSAGSGFQNITLQTGGTILEGSYRIGNAYRTIEFITNDLCGTNSCGGDVYCLPESSIISGLIKAATLSQEPPQAAGFPYNGIVDIAGNSLDGDGDGKAEGPESQSGNPAYNWVGGNSATEGDDIKWQFNTSDEIDLTAPRIISIKPGFSAQNVKVDVPIEATFSKVMSVFTLNNENLAITHDVPKPYELWYSVRAEALNGRGEPLSGDDEPARTKAFLKHGSFAPSVAGGVQYNYFPSIKSGVQDLRQNCYNPSRGPGCTPTASRPYCCNGVPSASKCSQLP